MAVTKYMNRIIAASEATKIDSASRFRSSVQMALHDYTYGFSGDPLLQFACVYSGMYRLGLQFIFFLASHSNHHVFARSSRKKSPTALIHDVDHPGSMLDFSIEVDHACARSVLHFFVYFASFA